MSEPVRIALAVEGHTDYVVLKAAVAALLPDREIEFQMVQPDFSVAFASAIGGETGMGWSGVYRWCRLASSEGDGQLSGSSLFQNHDLLVIHVDADVAGKTYQSARIEEAVQDLPCEKPCPPASDTIDALRQVILRWIGETAPPDKCVLCTPSKTTAAWVVIALCPENAVLKRGAAKWECHADPDAQLTQLPLNSRVRKTKADYEKREVEIRQAWDSVRKRSNEAQRFSNEFLASYEVVFG